jgi:hypothetical protein
MGTVKITRPAAKAQTCLPSARDESSRPEHRFSRNRLGVMALRADSIHVEHRIMKPQRGYNSYRCNGLDVTVPKLSPKARSYEAIEGRS